MSGLLDDADHWRKRAEEARAHAENLADRLMRDTMLEIARRYDRLAERTRERRTGGND